MLSGLNKSVPAGLPTIAGINYGAISNMQTLYLQD